MALPSVRLDTDQLPTGPWIFGRQVPPQDDLEDGALVEVLDRSKRFAMMNFGFHVHGNRHAGMRRVPSAYPIHAAASSIA